MVRVRVRVNGVRVVGVRVMVRVGVIGELECP